MEQRYIYIVFSSTPYKVGKLIRKVTREEYNHVSISLDEALTQMYSFSRRYYRLPLYGGFVHESRSRYHIEGRATQICVCALPVTTRQYVTLQSLLLDMHRKNRLYIYNHLSALGAIIHMPIRAKDAYTCVEFCVKILRDLGVDIKPGKYYSVGDIHALLGSYTVYTGIMPEPDSFDESYFAKKPVSYPALTTLRDMFKLLPRLRA